jgi:hypothetical protein
MNFSRIFILILLASFFWLLPVSGQAAEDVSYDRYASIMRDKPQSSSLFAKAGTDFLTYPLELLRWPMNKGAIFFDEHYLLTKGQWIYERAADFGITPRFDGVDLDLLRMTKQRARFPDLTLKSWAHYSHDNYFIAGGKAGMERIGETPVRVFSWVNYENRPEEYFYGIGPDTSRGEGTSYRKEATTVQGEVGYSKDPSASADVFAAYKRVNIGNGTDGGRGIIDRTFPNQTIAGLGGDEIFSTGIKFARDMRNQKENSTKGYLARTTFSFNEGLYGSDARFFHYDAELAHYQRLGSDRRVFVTRFYGEHNNETGGNSVPFHQMFRLGGFGSSVGSSETLRGYDRNRFTDETGLLLNTEYRYTVYEYRDWKMDTVLFMDAGQVFDTFGEFQLQDFRLGYGIGFRVSILNNVVLSLELAHGDEGSQFYVKSRSPF